MRRKGFCTVKTSQGTKKYIRRKIIEDSIFKNIRGNMFNFKSISWIQLLKLIDLHIAMKFNLVIKILDFG